MPSPTLLALFLVSCVDGDLRSGRHGPGGDDTAAPDTGIPDEDAVVEILSPRDGDVSENPVTFRFQADPGLATSVRFTCDGYDLLDEALPVTGQEQSFTRDFSGVNYERTVEAVALDAGGAEVGRDTVTFIPDEGWLPDEDGFNRYVVRAINDTSMYPKDETYPYCWSYYGDECGDMWGMVWGAGYLGEDLFPGGGDCFCSGHTLEIFLDAYTRWQADHGAAVTEPYGALGLDDVDLGAFYQHWQGYGVAQYASSAQAFETTGIGEELAEEDWPTAVTGDFVNLSRSTGTGHAVIFVGWLWEGDTLAGLRYYGCNGSGDSHPDPSDPDNVSGVSGPSFVSEYFTTHGGTVLTRYLFIGHPYDPATL